MIFVWVLSCLLEVNLLDILKKVCFKVVNIIFIVIEFKLNYVIMIILGDKVIFININDVFKEI